MKEFTIHDGDSIAMTIERPLRTIALYHISCKEAEDDIKWSPERYVPLTEARMIVYLQSGRNKGIVDAFTAWAEGSDDD